MTPFNIRTTERGFERCEFLDRNNIRCSLQQSSAIDDTDRGLNQPGSSFLWLGRDDMEMGGARMHLDRNHVQVLVALLSHWLDTGSLRMEPEGKVS